MTTYRIERDCCTAGDCSVCGKYGPAPTRKGTPARILHWTGTDLEFARRTMDRWAVYNPELLSFGKPRARKRSRGPSTLSAEISF